MSSDTGSAMAYAAVELDGGPCLSTIVQAVQFWLTVDGERVKALVLAEYLVTQYGAGNDPESWIAAFNRHRSEITASAARCHRAGKGVVIVSHACF